ncbi:MAG TPA: type II toxin-antitoxin system HicA family toxin [Streptosporangiaceae bacterium]
MPGSLPAVPGAKVVKALERAGFTVVRISGSHRVMRHPDSRTVVVPSMSVATWPRALCGISWPSSAWTPRNSGSCSEPTAVSRS